MIDVPAGHLYLGEALDLATRERTGDPVLVEAADLTTHGVIVGMTGSGKTGLGVVLLEEALLAGVPTLIIDPKGDLGNLLLAFPDLSPDEFAPWVEGGDAETVATEWREGLAGWGIEPARIAALREAAEFTIYTPGSTSGVPLNVVGSLRRPADGTDAETLADEVEGFVSGLLGMVGVDADPLSGREHILLSNLVHDAWDAGVDLDLPTLVARVQDPPLRKLGVVDLDTFFPPKDRTALAMTLNGLLASRAFAAWAEGPDLDIDRLLRSADGTRPGCAIVSLAHLGDEERQFVVSLLLGKLITWMRRQPGTDALRVLVYFDEVLGFVPPTAAPPAKAPILTLFKQARAFGVGMVLATQNPVDVDYKGLSNAGTWMIGRLQTEQDKARLLDGLSSAGGEVDVGATGDLISSLDKRQFVLRAAGTSAPSLFTTRWAMSYLRGPLTREQISTLMADRRAALTDAPAVARRRPRRPTSRRPVRPASPATPPRSHRRWPRACRSAGSTRRAVDGPGRDGPRRLGPRSRPRRPRLAALRRRRPRPAGHRGVRGRAVPARRDGRPHRPRRRRPRRARPSDRAPGRRRLRDDRRPAGAQGLLHRRREGPGRAPLPRPHHPRPPQQGPEAGQPARRGRGRLLRPLPGRGRRRRRRRPGGPAAEGRGQARQGPGRPRHRHRPRVPGPGRPADAAHRRSQRRGRCPARGGARRAPAGRGRWPATSAGC